MGFREWSSLVEFVSGVREWFFCFIIKYKKKQIQKSLKCSSVSLKVLKYGGFSIEKTYKGHSPDPPLKCSSVSLKVLKYFTPNTIG